ncbi:MAG: sigma-E processing peptidase SpoIIGA [Tyzzerella sp.]|nr:sigma-E processing peptidase SpoIIGA [Tyzzerella sp.]
MYYELYVDVLFLVNFTMDYLLLLLVRRSLKCNATHGNVFLGAIIGSLLTCIVIILPIPNAFLEFILFHALVNTCMIRVGLKIKTIRSFLKAMIMLYIGAFFMGGILEYFHQYVRIGSLFLLLAAFGYYVTLGIWNFMSRIHRWNQYHCKVELYLGEKKVEAAGLIDTGNGLCDPFTGRPVSILDRETARKLLGEEVQEGLRFIPYQSIGKKEGVLPIFSIDRMCVLREEACWFERPLIGISEERISAGGEYEMILNPNLF